VARGVVRDERVGAERSHEAFQTGEVSTSCREHQTRVKELTVEPSYIVQIMGWARQPIFDGSPVLGLLSLGDSHGAFR
jgi:hypothetical protein